MFQPITKTISTSFGVLIAPILLILGCSKWNSERIGLTDKILIGAINVEAPNASLIDGFEKMSERDLIEKVADIPYPLSISADGNLVAEMGSLGNLAIRDLRTGITNNITKSFYPQLVMNAVFSPVENRIAFVWHNEDDHDDIRVIKHDGSELQILYRDLSTRSIWVKAWTPDGKYILATLLQNDSSTHAVLIPAQGGKPQNVAPSPFIGKYMPEMMAISPNGDKIAYDVRIQSSREDHDIYMIDLKSGERYSVVENWSDDRLLGWNQSGSDLVFATNRSGKIDIMLQSIVNVEIRDASTVLHRDIGQMTPVGSSQEGAYYYKTSKRECHVYIGKIDPVTYKILDTPQILDFAIHNTGAYWSPDGDQLAYLKPRECVNPNMFREPWDLVIRSLKSEQEQLIQIDINRLHQIRPLWSPDGRFILLKGWDQNTYPREIVIRVNVLTSDITTAISSNSVWDRLIDWTTWSVDGKSIFYTDQTVERKFGIYKWNLESKSEEILYKESVPPFLYGLTSSPDGEYLAFGVWDTREQTSGLDIMHLKTGERNSIVKVKLPTAASLPVWISAKRLMYESDGKLWSVGIAGEQPTDCGSFPGPGYNQAGLSIHPDKSQIAFVGEKSSSSELWVIPSLLVSQHD